MLRYSIRLLFTNCNAIVLETEPSDEFETWKQMDDRRFELTVATRQSRNKLARIGQRMDVMKRFRRVMNHLFCKVPACEIGTVQHLSHVLQFDWVIDDFLTFWNDKRMCRSPFHSFQEGRTKTSWCLAFCPEELQLLSLSQNDAIRLCNESITISLYLFSNDAVDVKIEWCIIDKFSTAAHVHRVEHCSPPREPRTDISECFTQVINRSSFLEQIPDFVVANQLTISCRIEANIPSETASTSSSST